MSQWFDQSNNANKLRQSYLKGFLDISGGGIYMRSDNSLNFYTGEGSTPNFALGPTAIKVMGKRYSADGDSIIAVDNSKLAFLKDLKENAQKQLDLLDNNTKYIRSDASAGGIITIKKDAGNDASKNEIIVAGHIVPSAGETYDLGSAAKPFNSLYLKNNTIYFDDNSSDAAPASSMSFNTETGTLDISFNGQNTVSVLSYNNKVGIGLGNNRAAKVALDISGSLSITGDASMVGQMLVGGATELNSTLLVKQNATFNSKLIVTGDISLNGPIKVSGAATIGGAINAASASISGIVSAGSATVTGTLGVDGIATMTEELRVSKDVSFNSKLSVGKEVTMDDTLRVSKDVTFNSKLTVDKAVTMYDGLTVTKDVSFNSKLYVSGALSAGASTLNSLEVTNNSLLKGTLTVEGANNLTTLTRVFASGDVSMNTKLNVGGDVVFNSKLNAGTTTLAGLTVTSGVIVSGGEITATSSKAHLNSLEVNANAKADSATVTNQTQTGSLLVDRAADVRGILLVGGDASLNGKLYVDFIELVL